MRYCIHFGRIHRPSLLLLDILLLSRLLLKIHSNACILVSLLVDLLHLVLSIVITKQRDTVRHPIINEIYFMRIPCLRVSRGNRYFAVIPHNLKLSSLLLAVELVIEHVVVILLLSFVTLIQVVKDWIFNVAETKPAVENSSTVFFVPLSEAGVLVQLR